jgi:thioredoxin 1
VKTNIKGKMEMNNSIIELKPKNFGAIISKGTVLVDFWAPWCMPCLMQGPILETVAQKIGNDAVIAKVNVESFPELAQQFSIEGIPTLLLFKNGELAERLTGVQSERILLRSLQNAGNIPTATHVGIFA